MFIKKITTKIFLTLFLCFGLFNIADASILFFNLEKPSVFVGDNFFIDVVINTENDFINASQAVINFPIDLLEVVSINRSNSVFEFWVEEPTYSNEEGTISFVGGTISGLNDSSLKVFKINFKAKNSGLAEITISKPVITANDGEGTNVLRIVRNSNITINKPIVFETTEPQNQILETVEIPVIVEREAVMSGILPDAPIVRVPLYSDNREWYNYFGETIIFWDLPDDITKVAVDVNRNPNTEPLNVEESLFTGKNLGVLEEGVNYIHVQFKNNIGWGKVSHTKIAIDTTSPIAFDIKTRANISDNPTPEITFVGSDSLSGYLNSWISIDNQEYFVSTTTMLTLPPLKPGKHNINVKVFDKAGNSIDDDLELEVLPIDSPVVDFFTKKVSLGEVVYINGKGIPNQSVDYYLKDNEIDIFSGNLDVDILGKWELSINSEDLGKGNYDIIFISHDERNAKSYPTESIKFKVSARTILSIGFIDLTLFQIIFTVLLLFIFGGGIIYWYYASEEERRDAYKTILGRDIVFISDSFNKNLEEMETMFRTQKRLPSDFKSRCQTIIKDMQKRSGDMKKYITKTIRKS
jgi:hypothetical protein